MKLLDIFFLKTNLIYVWLINTIISSIIWILVWKEVKLCLIMSSILGLVVTGIVSLIRSANNFYRKAEFIEQLVTDAKFKEDIVEIQNGEFKKLRGMSFHQQTTYKIQEIYAVMKARYELLPNKEK